VLVAFFFKFVGSGVTDIDVPLHPTKTISIKNIRATCLSFIISSSIVQIVGVHVVRISRTLGGF